MPDTTAFAIVDAFTTQHPFSGNPAGVLLLDEFPDLGWMQGVANELRWFTPVAEVALCGHATLASAHWLPESPEWHRATHSVRPDA